MGKTYIDAVKYLIKASFEVDGMVEKPDLVGAVFGQTEGLLGDELDLRELQKNGRIGRIEVETQMKNGKTFGTIVVPSSLDMVETSILAASLEIVDRVGPCEARIKVNKIEDSRNLKRKLVLDRAKSLLKTMLAEEIPESRELSELVREEVKTSDVCTYGPENLPCGPNISASDSIILVEGRADVVNLLRNNIKNVVAVGGANIAKSIAELCKEKEVTVFVDGDRGGEIILQELMNVCEVDFVARAPPGKEVEELMRKELIKCLRRRIPIEQIEIEDGHIKETGSRDYQEEKAEKRERQERFYSTKSEAFVQQDFYQREQKNEVVSNPLPPSIPKEKIEQAKTYLKELEGTLKARILDPEMNLISEVPIREVIDAISQKEGIYAIVLDGIITQRLVELAEAKNVALIVGIKRGALTRIPSSLTILPEA